MELLDPRATEQSSSTDDLLNNSGADHETNEMVIPDQLSPRN